MVIGTEDYFKKISFLVYLCSRHLLFVPFTALLLFVVVTTGGSRIFGNWFLIKGIAGFKVKTQKKKKKG